VTNGVGDGDDSVDTAVPPGDDRGRTASLREIDGVLHRSGPLRVGRGGLIEGERRSTREHAVTVDDTGHAEPGTPGEVADLPRVLGERCDGARDGMLGRPLQRADEVAPW
jgi:hypothetical protein